MRATHKRARSAIDRDEAEAEADDPRWAEQQAEGAEEARSGGPKKNRPVPQLRSTRVLSPRFFFFR